MHRMRAWGASGTRVDAVIGPAQFKLRALEAVLNVCAWRIADCGGWMAALTGLERIADRMLGH
eukprot:13270649-Alexandrium_andersonii.AAC.1